MNKDFYQTAQDFIVLPFALKIFQQDKELFKEYKSMKSTNVFVSMLDAAIEGLQTDLNHTKQQLYAKYHTDIKRTGRTVYRWHSKGEIGTLQFFSDELRQLTNEAMTKYMGKAENFKMTYNGWY